MSDKQRSLSIIFLAIALILTHLLLARWYKRLHDMNERLQRLEQRIEYPKP